MHIYDLQKSENRGLTQLDWLVSRHSFSFGGYFNPERINFGALRVLNQDIVSKGKGFGDHPHQDMEIITIPLQGSLRHRDSTGQDKIIHTGEVQLMSAGRGVFHSEWNASSEEPVHFLQIWIQPNILASQPSYQQTARISSSTESLQPLISPAGKPGGLSINQDAWIHWVNLQAEDRLSLQPQNPDNGIYVLLLEGQIQTDQHILTPGDGLGVWPCAGLEVVGMATAQLLVIEVPVNGYQITGSWK